MKTTVQALKELYATLGGNLADVALIERIPEMIEALNSIAVAVPAPTAEDKGKVITVGDDGALDFANALPPVTAEDAGKVMTVDEQGVWNPAEASGGGGVLLVGILDSLAQWGTTFAAGKTVETNVSAGDIAQAFLSGKMVVISAGYGEYSTILIPQIGQSTVNAYGYITVKIGTTAENSYERYYRVALINSANVSVTYFGSVKLLDAES